MYEKFKRVLNTATTRQSLVTIVSTGLNGVLGALFYFFTARWLGPAGFGVFAVCVAIVGLLSDILDFGAQQGTVRFVSRHRGTPAMWEFARLGLAFKVIPGIVGFLLFIVLSGFISGPLLHRPEILPLVPILGAGILIQMLFSFSTAMAQGQERFYLWGSLFVGTNFFRLLFLVWLYYSGSFSQTPVIFLYCLIPLTGFIFSLPFFGKRLFVPWSVGRHFGEFIGFNKWVAGFVLISAFNSRLDTFLSARFLSLVEIGIYSLASQVVTILPQMTVAIGAVISPKFASFQTKADNLRYIRKASLLTGGISLAGILTLIPAGWLVLHWSGSQYASGLLPLVFLLLAMGLFMATAPLRDSLIYYFGRPDVFFWTSFLQLIVTGLGGVFLIPALGITGAALSVFISHFALAVVSLISFLKINASHT